jgi:dTDP-4-dehydrorhamnose 3,5-epimerase
MKFNEDDRAQRLLDVVEHIDGQINVSYVNSTWHIVAWHRHKIQTDYWICLRGSFKVGLAAPIDEDRGRECCDVKWEYVSDKNFRVLRIPPGVWHGYKALEPGSIMLYYLTRKYDVNDEEKVLPGFFSENWETENK